MRFQRELAGYLAQFTPGPHNVYVRMLRSLGHRRVIYSSLNYDLLFELAAASMGLSTQYDVTANAQCARLLKLHGSSNFWPNIPLGMLQGCTFSRSGRADVQAPIRVLGHAETLNRCAKDDSLAPAIAMYALGKAVKISPDYVENQQQKWCDALMRAKNVFVVGVRVHPADEHIWGTLAATKARVTYFGLAGDKPEFLDWCRAGKKKHAYFVEATFEACVSQMKARLN